MDELREKILDELRKHFTEGRSGWFDVKGFAMMMANHYMCTKNLDAPFREIYEIVNEAAEDFYFGEGK